MLHSDSFEQKLFLTAGHCVVELQYH